MFCAAGFGRAKPHTVKVRALEGKGVIVVHGKTLSGSDSSMVDPDQPLHPERLMIYDVDHSGLLCG